MKLLTDFNKMPTGAFTSWMFVKGKDFYHDRNGIPDLVAFQSNITMQRDLGFVKSELDVEKLADLSYIKEAAQRAK